MDIDTTINGLTHELWALAQGRAPIDDVVTPMMVELYSFADTVRAAERERCAAICDKRSADHWHDYRDRASPFHGDLQTKALSDEASECAAAIRHL